MSVQTHALVYVWFGNHTTFDSKRAVEDYIDECQSEIDYCKKQLTQLAWMTEPKKFIDEDQDPGFYIQNTLAECFETLEDAYFRKTQAELVLRGWDHMHHDCGAALAAEDRDLENLQRIDGDFICTVNPDGSNALPDCETNTQLYNQIMKYYKPAPCGNTK